MNLSPFSVAFIVLLAAILLVASIAATVLGWVAVAKIRRSAGQLYGLGLALFDGLLFPLLALDVLIARLVLSFGVGFLGWSRSNTDAHHAQWILLTVVLALVVDFLIVCAVWRAVKVPSANSGPAQPAGPTDAPRKSSSGKWIAVGCAVLAVIGLALVLLSLAGLFYFRMSSLNEARSSALRHESAARQKAELVRQVRFKFSHPDQMDGGRTITVRAKDGTDAEWVPSSGQPLLFKDGMVLEFRARVDASTPGSTVAWVSTKRDGKWEAKRAELGAGKTSASLDFASGLHVSITLLEDEPDHPGISPPPVR